MSNRIYNMCQITLTALTALTPLGERPFFGGGRRDLEGWPAPSEQRPLNAGINGRRNATQCVPSGQGRLARMRRPAV